MSGLSKREFLRLLETGAPTDKPVGHVVDWDEVFRECKNGQGQEPFTVSDFHITYVQGAVSENRVRNKLKELYAQGKLLRVIHNGAYYYMWIEQELK